jgi:hypothetical protein
VDEEEDDPPGLLRSFSMVCSLRMFFTLVGRHEERTKALLLLVSRDHFVLSNLVLTSALDSNMPAGTAEGFCELA